MKFVIEGRNSLYGEVKISSSKNAVLKMIAASIMGEGTSTIIDTPQITDVETLKNIIYDLGADIKFKNKILKINPSSLKSYQPKNSLVKKLRASIVLVGPLLTRFGKAIISQPGGDTIGNRSIDTHIRAFEQLGVRITQDNGYYVLDAKDAKANIVILDEMSVTATENILMFAALLPGETNIRVAAAEPEIEDLANF